MSNKRLDIWVQEASADKYLTRRLMAMARSSDWWAGSINIMIGMVIQLLARDSMSVGEIAKFVGCPEGCIKLIAAHYGSTVTSIAMQYRELHENGCRDARL